MKKFILLFIAIAFLCNTSEIFAQRALPTSPLVEVEDIATDEAEASISAKQQQELQQLKEDDVTRVDPDEERNKRIELLFSSRDIDTPNFINFIGYAIQYSVKSGVPANTVILILILPVLATAVVFFRHVVGVPSLAMLLPIALSITLVATGLAAGLILLLTIVLSSTLARIILKKIRIMQFAKMALTIFIVSVGILATLTASTQIGILAVTQISIFPVLLLILLSQNIVELQVDRGWSDILMISAITTFLGVLGYFMLSYEPIRNFVIVYPELILLVVPINIMIGRYFGLRFTEYFRFSPITNHGNQQ
jgi:hypothetical protein